MSESGQVIRTYPMTPGIDLSELSSKVTIHVFQKKILYLLLVLGLASPIQAVIANIKSTRRLVSSSTKNMTLRQAMILGTAGFTAMLCVNALIRQGMTSDKKLSLLVLLAV